MNRLIALATLAHPALSLGVSNHKTLDRHTCRIGASNLLIQDLSMNDLKISFVTMRDIRLA